MAKTDKVEDAKPAAREPKPRSSSSGGWDAGQAHRWRQKLRNIISNGESIRSRLARLDAMVPKGTSRGLEVPEEIAEFVTANVAEEAVADREIVD